jgi:hypothetical protein
MTRPRILIGILFVAALALLFIYSIQTHHPDNTVHGIGAGKASTSRLSAPRAGAASAQASDYLTFQRPNGTRGYLRLQCGFQPSVPG